MKRLTLTILMSLCGLSFIFAQGTFYMGNRSAASQKPPKTIDTTILQVTFKSLSIIDSLAPDRVSEDKMILQIGKTRISKFFADTRVRDSIIQATIGRSMTAEGNVRIQTQQIAGRPSGPGDQSVIIKNYPAGRITVTDRVMMDQYTYTEPVNDFKWIILPDTDTLFNFLCQKATTTFRGRDYEAWFAPGIPINEGPWKFSGLPGLVLKISDSKQHYVYECVSLEQIATPIEFADADYVKTNRRDLAKVKRKFYEDPVSAMESMRASAPAGDNVRMMVRNQDGTTTSDINEIRNNMRNRAYNPIELDL